MALYSDLPLYKATYDLLLGIFRFTKDFGEENKYTVEESLKKGTIELLTLIYRANVIRDKQVVLQEARPRAEKEKEIMTRYEIIQIGKLAIENWQIIRQN